MFLKSGNFEKAVLVNFDSLFDLVGRPRYTLIEVVKSLYAQRKLRIAIFFLVEHDEFTQKVSHTMEEVMNALEQEKIEYDSLFAVKDMEEPVYELVLSVQRGGLEPTIVLDEVAEHTGQWNEQNATLLARI